MTRFFAAALAAFTLSAFTTPGPARAMNIETIKSPGGISAWLVRAHNNPLLALKFVFEGGSSQDPEGKNGVANFLSGMMDEGAGDLESGAFQEQMETLAMRMRFDDARDAFYGSFETLTANRDASAELLKLAITKPRFDEDAVERIRRQIQANLVYADRDPDKVAVKEWFATSYKGHAYGRNPRGTEKSIAGITAKDLEDYRKRIFVKDRLKVVAVGDITAEQLGALLDKIFGDLPATGPLLPVDVTSPKTTADVNWVEMNVPQSVAIFGLPSMPRKDPDFLTAFVINHIVGSGGFSSRLMEEVREKRGLAYSVYSYIQPYKHTSVLLGSVATRADAIDQSLSVIRTELRKIADNGPTAEDLENAKSYLIGSYPLRFDTNAKIARQLLGLHEEGFGPDYIDTRNDRIRAITLEEAKRVAKRLYDGELIVTVVGSKAMAEEEDAKKVAPDQG